MRRTTLWASAAFVAVGLGAVGAASAAASYEVVTPTNLQGWQPIGAVVFETGPLDPPCGDGSAEFRIGPSGAEGAQLRDPSHHGARLADLTTLGYATYVEFNNNEQAAYVILDVDLDGDLGTTDTELFFFEPVYQDATFFPSNPQGDVVVGLWQEWDARNGGWWSVGGSAGATPGTGVKSIDHIVAAFPDAVIVNSGTGLGGVRLVAGFGGPADWGNFIGNADCFDIGFLGNVETSDFEADPVPPADEDGDDVPDEDDLCPDSDLRPFVDVNGDESGDTGIPNTVDADGCSIQDDVDACRTAAKNHGQYVKCVGELARELQSNGEITKDQAQAMKNAAAKSSVGKS
jgi:hypothetical protein